MYEYPPSDDCESMKLRVTETYRYVDLNLVKNIYLLLRVSCFMRSNHQATAKKKQYMVFYSDLE